jgi:hypothetical protein
MLDEPLLTPVLQHLKYGVLVDTGTLYGYAVLLGLCEGELHV